MSEASRFAHGFEGGIMAAGAFIAAHAAHARVDRALREAEEAVAVASIRARSARTLAAITRRAGQAADLDFSRVAALLAASDAESADLTARVEEADDENLRLSQALAVAREEIRLLRDAFMAA